MRPSALELEAAESFVNLIDAADMVKFTKDGSTANTAAVKLARAFTGRDLVAICIDHPFYSYDDWAMVATPIKAGIAGTVEALTLTFRYNAISSVEDLLALYPGRIACFVFEPERTDPPRDGFLQRLHKLAHDDGALLVLDENVTGFRWDNGGGQAVHGIGSLIFRRGGEGDRKRLSAVRACGTTRGDGARRSASRRRASLPAFDDSWGGAWRTRGRHRDNGRIREEPVVATMLAQGERLRAGLQRVIDAHGIGHAFSVFGKSSCLYYGTRDAAGEPSQSFRTLFLQETVSRGLLAPSFVISYAHR